MNVKKKGNAGENRFANWLYQNGIKAWRNGSSGAGMYKGDINNSIDYTFEVKTVKRIGLLEAWKQVNRDSSIARNTPALAIHFDNMPNDTWLMVLHSEDWVALLKENRELKSKINGNN